MTTSREAAARARANELLSYASDRWTDGSLCESAIARRLVAFLLAEAESREAAVAEARAAALREAAEAARHVHDGWTGVYAKVGAATAEILSRIEALAATPVERERERERDDA